MWGYGVDPPADFNPHLVSRMSARRGPALQLAGNHHALGLVAPPQVRVVTAVRFRGGALPEPTGPGGALEHALAYRLRHQDCAGNGSF